MEKVFQEMQIDDDKYYRVSVLYEVMRKIGIIAEMSTDTFRSNWFFRRRKRKLIIIPDITRRGNEPILIEGRHLKGIVRAFTPGGAGYYNYIEHGD